MYESIEFIFHFAIGVSDVATWIWVLIALVFTVLLIGSVWGKLWNREWSLTGKPGLLILVCMCAIGVAYSIFNLRSIGRLEAWFEFQRTALPKTLADSSRLQRKVLMTTWQQLESKGGQNDIVPPDQSGDSVRLNSPEDAFALASAAAEETRSSLRSYAPFIYGAPLTTLSPSDTATAAVDAVNVDASAFPRLAKESNEWTATAVTLQTQHALDAAYSRISKTLGDLRNASIALFVMCLAIPAIFVPFRAVDDIKVNPKP